MIVLIEFDDLNDFPKGGDPYHYQLLAENPITRDCCIRITGDIEAFKRSDIICKEVDDVPHDYKQQCLPSEYGTHLTLAQIEEIESILAMLTEEEAEQVESIGMLRLMKLLKQLGG